MVSNLIVMLTNNDLTVKNAREIFDACCDLPVKCWGFKNVGISEYEMKKLITSMKSAGKKTFLEVVTYTEDSCMTAAKFACEYGFDYLMGTLYFPSVWEYLKLKPIKYFPFIGNVQGSPSILSGDIESMGVQANEFFDKNIPGVDILAYRYHEGNPEQFAREIVKQIKSKAIIAGSIDSIERIKVINEINPWGFTIGSALFTGKFVNSSNFRTNLERVLEIMNSLDNPAA